MRIRLVVIAIVCLFVGAAVTPIVSPSAKSGKGSSCKNPYTTTGINGEIWRDRVVKIRYREKKIPKYIRKKYLRVTPDSGIRICKVRINLVSGEKVFLRFPSRGGIRIWSEDSSKGEAKPVDTVTVFSRRG